MAPGGCHELTFIIVFNACNNIQYVYACMYANVVVAIMKSVACH